MSLMINGELRDEDWLEAETEAGEFVRQDQQFRSWVTVDGSAGPSGEGGFAAEPSRYHLYVSYACPWAHRTLIVRELKGLQDVISVDVVHPYMGAKGWSFATDFAGASGDRLYGHDYLYRQYALAQSDYTGIVTVPVLWDKKRETIVNNESSEIIRMFNSAFNQCGANDLDLYPPSHRGAIDEINAFVYDNINNGVYKCGFATTQAAYEKNFDSLFAALGEIEQRLARQRYLTGEHITEADWRLFTTLVRFDAVYYSHFKCNRQRIADYPNMHEYLLELYQWPRVSATVHMDHIKHHYYASHTNLNPSGIVPKGPALNFDRPHRREGL